MQCRLQMSLNLQALTAKLRHEHNKLPPASVLINSQVYSCTHVSYNLDPITNEYSD